MKLGDRVELRRGRSMVDVGQVVLVADEIGKPTRINVEVDGIGRREYVQASFESHDWTDTRGMPVEVVVIEPGSVRDRARKAQVEFEAGFEIGADEEMGHEPDEAEP